MSIVRSIYDRLDDANLNVSTICKNHAISKSQAEQTMHDWTGQGLWHTVAEIRMIEAHTSMQVGSIAVAVGYTDLPVFDKAFRAHHGATPTQLRRSFVNQSK
jgi:transcriptional regulator GlxA family with amidase domain